MVSTARTLQTPLRKQAHAPLLHPPWFADSDEGVSLHRYFDAQFAPRFVQQAHSQRLSKTRAQSWYHKDRFGRTDLPTLRLPMHETFYIACCELSCDIAGRPAFNPAKLRSAGFVIRRRDSQGNIQRWMLQEGQALGWKSGLIETQEPDEYRRYVNRKLLPAQYPEPGYTGEETYPLHPALVRTKHSTHTRQHTLLWGYVPLGGSSRTATDYLASHTIPTAEATAALATELRWPFGTRNAHNWRKQDTRPCFSGIASQALYELLEVLIARYHIFDKQDADNSVLRAQLADIHFYPHLQPSPPDPYDAYAVPSSDDRADNLLEWIESSRDALLLWLSQIGTGKISRSNSPLPETRKTITSLRNDDLYISEQQAQVLRDSLLLRGGRAQLAMEEGLAMPRFGQGDDDRYFIVPFVRWLDECGCECIHWGQHSSLEFRVVAPLDPEAMRPRAIVLPALDDLKRGAARGVTMLAPKSLADLLRKFKPDMEMSEGGPGNPTGLCWNFSFSLPAITLCAMLLLMIVINLLNIVFFWLPWVFLSLPRLCSKLLGGTK